jgi:hypothetical protein
MKRLNIVAKLGTINLPRWHGVVVLCIGVLSLLTARAEAQNPGVEFTVFPANQQNGQLWVSAINGISSDGDTAALTTATGSVAGSAWWRRSTGIAVIPPAAFTFQGVPVPTWFLNITADGSHAVGGFSADPNVPSAICFYSDAEGLRSIGKPKPTRRPGYRNPTFVRAFAPTTDRVVVFYEEWRTIPNTPRLGDVRVWTAATNTWQPLFTPPVAGSYVEVTDMSDNGISIGVLWTGGVSGSGTRYSWRHHPIDGVTLFDASRFGTTPYLQSISSDGSAISMILDGQPTMTLLVNDVLQFVHPPNCVTSAASAVSNNASIVSGQCGIIRGSIRPGEPFVSDIEFARRLGLSVAPNQQLYPWMPVLSGDGSVRLVLVAESTLGILKITTPQCDTIDFNNDSLFPTDEDVLDFLTVLAGGQCSNAPNCFDIDFNNDGLFPSDEDLIAFLRVFAGGTCS